MKALGADDDLWSQLVDAERQVTQAERRVAQAKDETLEAERRVTHAKDETLEAKDKNSVLMLQLAYQRELLQSGLRGKGIVTTRGKCFFELRNAKCYAVFLLRRAPPQVL